jgi:predicted neuraminidase
VPESTGRVHGSLVPAASGEELLLFFRSRLADRIYRSRSSLSGEAWTPPEPIHLPNNNSSIQACRLASGRLAMIYNRFCFEPDPAAPQAWGEANWPRTRWPLSIALSADDGESWPWIRDIDAGFGFCGTANWSSNGALAYPSLLEGKPGDLHIAYSWGGRAAIRYLCLSEAEILGDTNG